MNFELPDTHSRHKTARPTVNAILVKLLYLSGGRDTAGDGGTRHDRPCGRDGGRAGRKGGGAAGVCHARGGVGS
jgi:hypothetical protein